MLACISDEEGLSCKTLCSYLVGEAGADGGLNALVHVCISKNNSRVFPSKFQGQFLAVGGAPLCDALGSWSGTSEGDQWDVRMANESVTCSGANSKYNVHYSWRNTWRDTEGSVLLSISYYSLIV